MSKKVVFNFGRYQLPHIGHGALIKKVHGIACLEDAEPRIYVSKTTNNSKGKNPLPFDRKMYWLDKCFHSYQDSFITEHENDIFKILISMYEEGVTDIVCVVGEDWVSNLEHKLNHYNDNLYSFDSIEIVSSGMRYGCTDLENASGTKMRELVKEGNLIDFAKYAPSGVHVVEYFEDMKKYVIKEEKIDS